MAVGDASIIDPDDLHRVEDRSALECRTARHHQEPAFVLAESSRSLGDSEIDRQCCPAQLTRHLAIAERGEAVPDRQKRHRAPVHIQRLEWNIDRVSACGTAGCPEFAYAYADAYAYGVNTSDPWG